MPLTLHHVDAQIDVTADLHVTGQAHWQLTSGETVVFDALAFSVSDVTVIRDGAPIASTYTVSATQLTVIPDAPAGSDLVVHISYSADPTQGIQAADGVIWTAFHTWAWLPCSSDPSQRATLSLQVTAPGITVATGDGDGPGPDVTTQIPHPAYTWGFVSGLAVHDDPQFPIWGTPHHALVRDRTQGAWDRWIATGFPAPTPGPYVQAFVPGGTYQELAGMAFLPQGYADHLVDHPTDDWGIVHELAHQLWGNRVTCATWGDFWLNEAVAVWWVARDKALRGDPEGYDREVGLWTARVERALARGDDPRVHRPGATPAARSPTTQVRSRWTLCRPLPWKRRWAGSWPARTPMAGSAWTPTPLWPCSQTTPTGSARRCSPDPNPGHHGQISLTQPSHVTSSAMSSRSSVSNSSASHSTTVMEYPGSPAA
jgi:hypothetical protein